MYFNSLLSPENQINTESPISNIAEVVGNKWLLHKMPKFESAYYHDSYEIQNNYEGYRKKNSNNSDQENKLKMERFVHGLQHACRVSMYIPIIVNLCRKFGIINDITEKNIKILQIAALFHDSARKGEAEDLWEHKSAELCFHFLISLGYGTADAIRAAEAVANKDLHYEPGKKRYGLGIYDKIDIKDNKIEWRDVKRTSKHNDIYQQVLHDADCFDVMRTRDGFDGKQLDFYKKIAKYNDDAFNTLVLLIPEIHRLINHQGDGRCTMDFAAKEQYELAPNCFLETEKDLANKNKYPLLNLYYNKGKLLSEAELQNIEPIMLPKYDPNASEPTADNLTNALFDPNNHIYSRGILTPSLVPNIPLSDILGVNIIPVDPTKYTINEVFRNERKPSPYIYYNVYSKNIHPWCGGKCTDDIPLADLAFYIKTDVDNKTVVTFLTEKKPIKQV